MGQGTTLRLDMSRSVTHYLPNLHPPTEVGGGGLFCGRVSTGESVSHGNLNIIQIRIQGNNDSPVSSALYDIQISRTLKQAQLNP